MATLYPRDTGCASLDSYPSQARKANAFKLWRAKTRIKDKIKKLKVEYQCQETLPKVQISGTSSTWVWFKHMRQIMFNTAKGDGPVGGCNQGHPSWGKPMEGEGSIPKTHVKKN